MSTTYPGTRQTFTNPSSSDTLNSPDHAVGHATAYDTITALEDVLGTTAGTSVLKNFSAGDFAARINGETLGTPKINHFTSTGTTVPSVADRALAPTVVTLADSAGGTITLNAPDGQVFSLTLGTAAGNRTFGTPTNPTGGQAISIAVKASGSANGTLVWSSVFRLSDAGTPTIGTASTWNYYGWRYNSTDSKWDFQGQSRNII